MRIPWLRVSNFPALFSPPEPAAPIQEVVTEVDTEFVSLLSDGPSVIFTTSPAIPTAASVRAACTVIFEKIGAEGIGGSVSRWCNVQNSEGTITDILTGATSNFDYDASDPITPGNMPAALAGASAQIVAASGPALAIQVTRPPGVPCRARIVLDISTKSRPSGALAASISPSAGTDLGGTSFTIAGDYLQGATSVTLRGAAATVLGSSEHSVSGVTAVGPDGVGDVVVTTPQGTTTISGGWTYTAGVIPTIAGITPNTSMGEGGNTVVITGTNFTGALAVKLCGVAQTYHVDSPTQITIATVADCGNTNGLGVGDVQVTSSTGNNSAAGNNLFCYLPKGIYTWHRADQGVTTVGGNATAWSDIAVGGTAYSMIVSGTLPFRSADALVNNKPTIAMQQGVGFHTFQAAASVKYTGTALTAFLVAARPTVNAGGAIFAYVDDTSGTDEFSSASNFGTHDASTTQTIGRNTVTSSGSVTLGTTGPFAYSARFTGSQGIVRVNGSDIATISVSGAFAANEMSLGIGWAGRFGGSPVGEMHTAEWMMFIRTLVAADYVTLSSYTNWRYGVASA